VWLRTAVFATIFGGLYGLVSLPIAYFTGFVLPRRFGLLHQSLGSWVADQVKMGAVGGTIGLVMIEVIYALLRQAPEMWWLWASVFLLVFNVLLANLAPVLLLPIFYKLTPLGEEHRDLEQRLLRLAAKAGTQVRGVYSFDMSRRTSAANAALTGLGGTRRIILGDTLMRDFTPDEIETVLAHELGHQVHRDIPLGILMESGLTIAGLYLAAMALAWGTSRWGFDGPGDLAAMPLLGMVMGAFGLVSMPLSNSYSRWRERLADEFALRITGKGQAFASAFIRLANQNLAETDPPAWEEFLLYSHLAIGKRIALASQYMREPATTE